MIDGVGLNMTVMSYLDHVDFGIVADRDQIPDLWPLLRAAQREVEQLAGRMKDRVPAGAEKTCAATASSSRAPSGTAKSRC